jgi:hypothetical protein
MRRASRGCFVALLAALNQLDFMASSRRGSWTTPYTYLDGRTAVELRHAMTMMTMTMTMMISL